MKIVHIAVCLKGGGIQNFLLSLLPEQVRLGHEVSLIVIEKDTNDYCELLANRLRNNGVYVVNLGKKIGNKVSLLKTLISCRQKVTSLKPDILNTHGEMSHVYGAITVLFTKIPHCITVHNAPENWDVLNKLLNSDKPIIYCSEAAYELRTQCNKRIISINNGISPSLVKTDQKVDLRNELRLSSSDKIILSVGSLRPQKNYEFLKVLSDTIKDKSIHFCICGGNYGDGYINPKIFDNYPNIHCIGLRSDVSAIENTSDLFLSCAKFEGLPIAVLEAFFNGIPCVLSPIVQHEKIAKGVDDCFIPAKFEPKDFVYTIKKALEIKKSHEDIYNSRLQNIKKYSISYTAVKYIEFYKKCINE